MGERLPFTKKERERIIRGRTSGRLALHERYGHRPVNHWGDGDLPGPWAVGDIVRIPEGARAFDQRVQEGPGNYVVVTAFSIDAGDAWYFRVSKTGEDCSDRLHVAYAARSTQPPWDEDLDFLEGCTLVDTADPAGLELREQMLAAGWALPQKEGCSMCGRPW